MGRFSAVAALLLAAAPLCAADPSPPADTQATTPWYNRIFGSSKPKAEPKPPPVVEKPITRQDVVRSLEQEQKVYYDRDSFCIRLRQIAVETGDEELLRKAEELDRLAFEVYQKRTSKLPKIMDDVRASEAALEEKRNAPAAGSASASRVVTGRAPNGRPIVGPTQE
jgi:hypothetical protein